VKLATRDLGIRIISVFAISLLAATLAQAQSNRAQGPLMTSDADQEDGMHEITELQTRSGAKFNPKEEAAYKAFYSVNPELPDKKIQLGNDFLQKYPTSILAESVEVGLMNAYYAKQDWKDFYSSADKALVLEPDDVDVLITVGWVIPHVYDPNEPDADQKLAKAETYEKHAIEVITTMPKPAYEKDAQFAASKNQESVAAHTALGLVYFRREDYENSAKELQQSVAVGGTPDPTDLYILGFDLQNLKRYSEAADAFNRCGQIPGAIQDRCKQSADESKKSAALSK